MKKVVGLILSLIFLIPLISAQFSASDIFSFIDAQSVFLLVVFGVLGLLLSVILNRFPAFQGTTAGLMSILLSLGMTYGINKWINVNDFFFNLGYTGDIFPYLLLAFFVLLIFLFWKFKWKVLPILGLLLILMALFTDLVYEKLTVLIIGIVLIAIWLIRGLIRLFKKKDGKLEKIPSLDSKKDKEQVKQQETVQRQRTEFEKMNLARKIGVRNLYNEYSKLEEEYNKGIENAKKLHAEATRLGWNTQFKPRKGESPEQTRARESSGREAYKTWYRQYQRLEAIRNNMAEIQKRIEYLKKQIK